MLIAILYQNLLAPPQLHTLSLHDALPILPHPGRDPDRAGRDVEVDRGGQVLERDQLGIARRDRREGVAGAPRPDPPGARPQGLPAPDRGGGGPGAGTLVGPARPAAPGLGPR